MIPLGTLISSQDGFGPVTYTLKTARGWYEVKITSFRGMDFVKSFVKKVAVVAYGGGGGVSYEWSKRHLIDSGDKGTDEAAILVVTLLWPILLPLAMSSAGGRKAVVRYRRWSDKRRTKPDAAPESEGPYR